MTAPPRQSLFTASRLQTATYLLGVCPFSIAFLVFLNSSVSFVVTDVIGLESGHGDAIGTLGFADELLALLACPAWGLLSDRIGVRYVCTAGYAIIALALFLFVQATNVYPQLLFGRLLFSLGGSAVSTMVTAVLPAVTGGSEESGQHRRSHHAWRASLSSEVTITPSRFERRASRDSVTEQTADPSSRLAGFVGLFAGCGALIALSVFLPLPARFEKQGSSPAQAVKQSYYIVGSVALLVSIACFLGLRNLQSEQGKHLRSLWTRSSGLQPTHSVKISNLPRALSLSVKHPDICLGYVGGFVARASSVGISLFIPLFVNHYFRSSDLCNKAGSEAVSPRELGEIKKSCPEAYMLASILTGVSQLIALLTAPAFGYLSEKSRVHNFPLLFAAISGIIGYVTFPLLPSPQFKGPDGNNGSVFLIMGFVGMSQIGAIVCSLGILSNGVLNFYPHHENERISHQQQQEQHPSENEARQPQSEHEPLLSKPSDQLAGNNLNHLKGSIAGIYSLFGGAGILILTKLGGLLFDELSSGAPFYIMAIFNGILLISGIGCSIWRYRRLGR